MTTPKQAHVLANLDRVVPLPCRSLLPRYQLDGVECTAQLKSLLARKLIRKHSGGMFMRGRPPKDYDKLVGDRQPPLTSTVEAMRRALLEPATVRAIGSGKR